MLSYTLSPELVAKIRDLQNKVTEQYAQMQHYSEDIKAMIHRYAKISMIGASTRIENAMLTDVEIDWIDTILAADGKTTAFESERRLIEDRLSKDRERSIEEVAGCRGMLELIYHEAKDMVPLTEAVIKGLHQELMRYYPKAKHYAGRYKISPNSVTEVNHFTKEKRVVFQPAEAGPITEAAMQTLLGWYNQNFSNTPWTLPFACEFTYRFLAIHPFQDGNGRLGRGLFLLALLQSPDIAMSQVAQYLPVDRHVERRKSEYYSVLNRCSGGRYLRDPKKYHIDVFLRFMLRVLNDAIDDIQHYKLKCDAYQKLPESALQVLVCFKEHPEIRLMSKQLELMTDLPKRTITHALSLLVKGEFLERYGQGAGVRYQLVL